MCAKAISMNGLHLQPPGMPESLTGDNSALSLGKFGNILGDLTGTNVSIFGEDHIRISTPNTVEDEEIRSLKELIANSLYLPVTIFRESHYIEIMAI